MCATCGCDANQRIEVELEASLLAGNERDARHNREHFVANGVRAVNLMGSPGSGKTALLEATARTLGRVRRLAAFSGDLETDLDARRLAAAGMPAVAISTGTGCHLDAAMVHHALHDLRGPAPEFLFLENVGNLVCPALFDLGEAARVVVLSVTEGEDKPLKYPVMFREAELVVLTKVDLLRHLPGVRVERIESALARVMPEPRLLPLSAVTGEGVERWTAWLEGLAP